MQYKLPGVYQGGDKPQYSIVLTLKTISACIQRLVLKTKSKPDI